MVLRRLFAFSVLGSLLAACTTPPPVAEPAKTCDCTPSTATTTTTKPLPPKLVRAEWSALPGWREDDLQPAFAAFEKSCKALAREPRWAGICQAMPWKRLSGNDLRAWAEATLEPHQVVNGDGSTQGMMTGYYEPLLRASRVKRGAFQTPLYGAPDDLLTIDLGDLHPELKGQRVRGRLEGKRVVPYASREDIASGKAKFTGKPLFFVEDPIEAFFLEVQGSGRLALDDGTAARVNYADQNGHPYRSIGRWLVEKGEMKLEQASMQSIKEWAQRNPLRLNELLNVNPSVVFYREIRITPENLNDGPLGALGVPLTEGRSLAVDRNSVPLGAPVFLSTTYPLSNRALNRLMVAQDVGGAIRGGVRGDYYWGSGAAAGAQAGRMRQQGQMWVLLPR